MQKKAEAEVAQPLLARGLVAIGGERVVALLFLCPSDRGRTGQAECEDEEEAQEETRANE